MDATFISPALSLNNLSEDILAELEGTRLSKPGLGCSY